LLPDVTQSTWASSMHPSTAQNGFCAMAITFTRKEELISNGTLLLEQWWYTLGN